ncbi:hypothetical protein I7I53_10523 [Histoplasma capsulatum var. duboisii H88]|uniref:Uncharacterized protein n=1 Tax=Ajellomyces capsulatus (strain H88) TaxID=544711 RepID=A0A8A1L7N8_AJEC8|nr:hypothetical protein I7I53_10523 [Histoplasma capsulatum var. duboisii H88]
MLSTSFSYQHLLSPRASDASRRRRQRFRLGEFESSTILSLFGQGSFLYIANYRVIGNLHSAGEQRRF